MIGANTSLSIEMVVRCARMAGLFMNQSHTSGYASLSVRDRRGVLGKMDFKLEDVLREYSVRELSPDGEYVIEFTFRIKDHVVKFQSHPMSRTVAYSVGKEISGWCIRYQTVRTKVALLHSALYSVVDVAKGTLDQCKREVM